MKRKGNGIALSHEKYATDLLERVGMKNYKPTAATTKNLLKHDDQILS
jgi:hypothetical protein